MKRAFVILLSALVSGACSLVPQAPAPALISRDHLFGNPERTAPQLSPDGTMLGYLAPLDGVVNVWIAPVDDLAKARPVTRWKERPVIYYVFAYDNKHLLFLQDKGGNENYHLYRVDLRTGTETDLTPIDGIQAQFMGISPKRPGEVLVGINDRGDRSLHDPYRIEIATGKRRRLAKNPGFAAYISDQDLRIRLAVKPLPDGGFEYLRKSPSGTWSAFTAVPQEDTLTTSPMGFDAAGTNLFWLDSRGRDTSAVVAQSWKSGATSVLFQDPRADANNVLWHPVRQEVQAVASSYERQQWTALDAAVGEDLAFLKSLGDGQVDVLTRSQDDKRWLVSVMRADRPLHYFLYDRVGRQTRFLFSHRPWLENQTLSPMHARVIPARDGLPLVSYITLPAESDPDRDGVPNRPLPTVLNVHGGPWGRDAWGYNSEHLWLANRGYAVLSVNYRASSGFGKKFLNAGNNEFAGKMHDDLLDAVEWGVKHGIVDRERVAIYGGSYGGYATLVGLTFTPDTFACGVDIVGPSNLVTLINSFPAYWRPFLETTWYKRVGDPRTEEGRKQLEARSPLFRADQIKKPLLIAQGANDPRVTQKESDQIVAVMQEKKIPVTYVLYPDEGHGFLRAPNRRSFYAVSEAFLGQCLGGRVEPVGADFAGSTLQIKAGVEFVPAVAAALAPAPPSPTGQPAP